MKVAVSSYSFQQLVDRGAMTQFDTIAKAKELGFDAIEFAELTPPDGVSLMEYAKSLREETARVGIPVSNFAFTADFLNGSNGDTAAEIARVKEMIDVAAELGVTRVRHDCTAGQGTRSFESVLPQLADAVRAVAEYAQQKGIRTMVENHGYFCQDSTRVEQLMAAVNHPNFGLLVDMGNFLCVDENPITAVSRTAPMAFYAHAKDFYVKSGMEPAPGRPFFLSRGGNWLRGAIIGQGQVPVQQCIAILRRAGYDDMISIEFEGMEDNLEGLAIGLENLRRFIRETD